MLRMIRAVVKADVEDFKLELGIQAGAWLLAEAITLIVVHLAGDAVTAPAAGTAAVVYGGLLCIAITDVTRFMMEYGLHLRFPLTRRGALLGHLAAMLVHNAVLAAGALVWAGAGAILHPLLYAGMGLRITPTFAYTPWFAWLILLLAPQMLAVLIVGILTRFGRVGGWVLYALFMIVCLSLNQIIDFFESFGVWANAWMLLAGGALALAVLLVLCVRWLLKAAV